MEYVSTIANAMVNNLPVVLLVLSILIVAAFVVFVMINIKLSKVSEKYKQLTKGMDGKNIEDILLRHIDRLEEATGEVKELRALCTQLDQTTKFCYQKMGVVRFNAFDNVGGEMSFAVALLDQNDNGVILSGIYGREESRVYAKPVQQGQSTYYLSDEEQVVLSKAQNGQSAGFLEKTAKYK